MKAKIISVFAASLLLLLGCAVMLGWFLHIPVMVQIFPGFVGMVFNSALLFALIGITVLFANFTSSKHYNFLLHTVGIVIVLFAILVFTQHIFKYSIDLDGWAIKAWLHDPNPMPGRMAPNTAIAFFLSGIIIFFIPIHHKKIINILVPLFIFIILLAALIGVLIYSFKLEYVFSWYNYTRMAIHTALGFILVSLALWCLIIQSPHFVSLYEGRDEKKILVLSGTVMVILALITGLGSIAITAYSSFTLIKQSFKESMINKIDIIETEINTIERVFQKIVGNRYFQKTVLSAIQTETQTVHEDFALIFLNSDYSIKIISPNGKMLYEQGQLHETPQLSVHIKTNLNASLLWDNGFWLRFEIPIYANQKIIGKLIGESPLPNSTKLYLDYTELGKKGENIICIYMNKNQAQCFPSRLHKQPFTVNFTDPTVLLPMYFALRGEVGVDNMMNYHGQRVIAAYSPIDNTGLGFAVEMDAQEVYQPLNRLLIVIFPLVLLLTLFGLLLLRWQVIPLVRKVISSEREAKKNKMELERIEKRYEIAVTSSNTGLWEWEKSTDNFYASDLFKKMLGYTKDEFPNTLNTFFSHIHPDDKEHIVALFSDKTVNKKTFSVEYRIQNKAGNYGWFKTVGQMIVNDRGETKGMAGSLLDINERKKIQDLKGEFISTVSHELRTPLTSIRGALGLILSGVTGSLTDKTTSLLKIANNNAERLINLINDILDVEKIESGKINLELKPISISKVVKESLIENQMYADLFSVSTNLKTDLPDAIVNADYGRLMQVLNNLLSNAIKFSPPQEVVSVNITRTDNTIRVAVSDKGIGISEEFKKRIFQKFSQSDSSSTRKVSGTGLGLNIAKGIMEAMNGKLDFYNENPGATFYFELPASSDVSSEEYETVKMSQILICENDAGQAESAKNVLTNAGYQCDIAQNAAETKAMLKDNVYQVLLINLLLPDQDGISLIRDIQHINTTPIIVISDPDNTLERKILNADAYTIIDWFEKPIDFYRLLLVLDFIKKDTMHIVRIKDTTR